MTITIVDFDPRYAGDFRTLNEAWLKRYFEIEPIDAKVLGDPQTHIIDGGGEILFALQGERALGTCALKPAGDGVFELTKMAVDERAQGQGVGRKILEAVIERFEARAGRLLFLESHTSLEAALALYRSAGFVELPRPFTSDYARSDIYMEWRRPAPSDRP